MPNPPAVSSISEDPILGSVRTFIQSNFLYMRPDYFLGADDRFLQNRVLDSMGVMELVIYLRREFGIEIPESDILEANLGSLRAVTTYVRTRVGSAELE